MLLLLEAYPCVVELPVELGLVRVVKEAVLTELGAGAMLRGLARAAPAIRAMANFILVKDIVGLDSVWTGGLN
jgi:hypothetical protein